MGRGVGKPAHVSQQLYDTTANEYERWRKWLGTRNLFDEFVWRDEDALRQIAAYQRVALMAQDERIAFVVLNQQTLLRRIGDDVTKAALYASEVAPEIINQARKLLGKGARALGDTANWAAVVIPLGMALSVATTLARAFGRRAK